MEIVTSKKIFLKAEQFYWNNIEEVISINYDNTLFNILLNIITREQRSTILNLMVNLKVCKILVIVLNLNKERML